MKPRVPDISIIVCTYNRSRFLEDTLRTLRDQTHAPEAYEVLVIDNNSRDDTEAVCRSFADRHSEMGLRYVFEAAQGLSHARNRGIVEAAAPLIAFVDDDVFADRGYVATLVDFFDKHADAIAAGGRISVHFETDPPAWISPRLMPLLGEHDLGQEVIPYPRDRYPLGGNMCFRREILEQHRFNTALGRRGDDLLASEEKDLFDRIRREDGKVYYLPGALIHHRVEGNRFSREFVRRQAIGIGRSERLRIGRRRDEVMKKAASEAAKLGGSFVLAAAYAARLRFAPAAMLLKFRYWIWLGLTGRHG